jgi:predicted secreted protein
MVIELSLCLPGTNAEVEKVFSLVNALWMDERNRLEVSTVKSIVPVEYHIRNYKCPEFHKFLL